MHRAPTPPRPTFPQIERITTLWFTEPHGLSQTRRQKPQNAALTACDGLGGPNHASRGQPLSQRPHSSGSENAALPDTIAPRYRAALPHRTTAVRCRNAPPRVDTAAPCRAPVPLFTPVIGTARNQCAQATRPTTAEPQCCTLPRPMLLRGRAARHCVSVPRRGGGARSWQAVPVALTRRTTAGRYRVSLLLGGDALRHHQSRPLPGRTHRERLLPPWP